MPIQVDTVEEAKENVDSDSRSSNMSTPITSPASVSPRRSPAPTHRLAVGGVKAPASHKNPNTIPGNLFLTAPGTPNDLSVLAVSYSSSDDDEEDFFDAHDDVASKASSDLGPPPDRWSLSASTLLLHRNTFSSGSIQEEKTLVSPLTPSEVDWDSLYEEVVEEGEVDMKSHGSVITHLLSQESLKSQPSVSQTIRGSEIFDYIFSTGENRDGPHQNSATNIHTGETLPSGNVR